MVVTVERPPSSPRTASASTAPARPATSAMATPARTARAVTRTQCRTALPGQPVPGSSSAKRVPPGPLVASSRPSMRSASSRAIASPRPVPLGGGAGPAEEALEDAVEQLLRDPRAVVGHDHARPPRRRLGAQRDGRARRRVANRVVDEHPENLEHAPLVAARERRRSRLDDDERAAAAGERLHLARAVRGQHAELELVVGDRDAPGVEARDVEQIRGQLRQPLHLLAHRVQELAALLPGQPALREQLEVAAERRQRRPQLVRGVGDERGARALERLESHAHLLE